MESPADTSLLTSEKMQVQSGPNFATMARRMATAIKVSVGKEETKSFASIDEFEKWWTAERAFWSKLESQSNNQPSEVWNTLRQRGMDAIGNQISEWKSGDERRRKSAHDSIVSFCQQLYKDGEFFTSSSPAGIFIQQVQEKSGPRPAAYAAAFLLGLERVNFENQWQLESGLEAFCFEQGLKSRNGAEKQALAKLREEWETKFNELRNQHADEIRKLQDTVNQKDGAFNDVKSKLDSFFQKSQADWAGKIELYETKLALAAPVTYWGTKAKRHLTGSIWFGVATLIAGGVAFWQLRKLAKAVLTPPNGIADPEKWHPAYWETATFLIGAALAVWILRILVKLLLSQIHLRSDASERVTMVNTYLALLETKKATDEDRKLIMAALFRPAATGVVTDEGMPLPSLEMLTRSTK